MVVSRDGEFYKVTRITGPTHNFLSVKFGDTADPHIEPLDKKEVDGLHAKDVKYQVLSGIREANNRLCTDYQAAHIQFVRSDSPPIEIYNELALHITLQMHRMRVSST